ncbi:MAG: hypothetical protein WAZ34_09590 [Rhodocyclaceae bacterium]
MPRLIRSPEEILRTTGRDIFFIKFSAGAKAYKAGRDPDGHTELVNWFAKHLPHVTPELIGPSEFSGWICGGISGDLYLNWTKADIATFSAAWENEDGDSLDSRFQCYHYPIAEFERRVAEHGDPRMRDV